MSQSTTFEGRSPEELQAKVRRTLGVELDELTVVRHGKERYGGFLGFFQRERWLVEVETPPTDSKSASKKATTKSFKSTRSRPSAPEPAPPTDTTDTTETTAAPEPPAAGPAGPLDRLLEDTSDLVNVDFGQAFADVLADAEAAVASPALYRPPTLPELDDNLAELDRGLPQLEDLLPRLAERLPDLAGRAATARPPFPA